MSEHVDQRGPLAWMAKNSVAANLLMIMLMLGGWLLGSNLKREVFPEVPDNSVTISAAYPGADPAQVERAVLEPIEQSLASLEITREIRGSASEGSVRVNVSFVDGISAERGLDEVERAVSRITTFPALMERPQFQIRARRSETITVMIHGPDADLEGLKRISERIRTELTRLPEITVVTSRGLRDPEISVEVDPVRIEELGLTRADIARAITASVRTSPGGSLDTEAGEVLLRVGDAREDGAAIREIPVLTRPDGTIVRVEDVAHVVDGFSEGVRRGYFDGERAVRLDVFRVGDERPLVIAQKVKEFVAMRKGTMPVGYEISIWDDETEEFGARIDLLTRNATTGLILVMLILGIFLSVRLSFWVTLGIPISFLGAMWFVPLFDVSINMISLFGFIIVLGIVVDDAIVVGEAIYAKRSEHDNHLDAAIAGVREVGSPVVFSVLTTVVAFSPLIFVPEQEGKFFQAIPFIVIPILLLSLVEALLILPAHLAHGRPEQPGALRSRFDAGLDWVITRLVRPVVSAAVSWRWATLAAHVALFLLAVGSVRGGHLKYTFFPDMESNYALAGVDMPLGTDGDRTEAAMKRVVDAAYELEASYGERGSMIKGVYSSVGRGFRVPEGQPDRGPHLSFIAFKLVEPGERPLTTAEFSREWRERVGQIPGATRLVFDFSSGPIRSGGIALEFRHTDEASLQASSDDLARALAELPGVYNIEDGRAAGKPQLVVRLKARGEELGLDQRELGRQVRAAFFGEEAARLIRGRDELRVIVRRALRDRSSVAEVDDLPIQLPGGGGVVALSDVAEVEFGRGFGRISHIDGERVRRIEAKVDSDVTSSRAVMEVLESSIIPQLEAAYPGLRQSEGGRQKSQRRIEDYLLRSTVMALLAMFALMAVAFRSYVQPLIIMLAIPFGVVGAFAGHLLLGYDLSLVSILGIVALSGVVVNDALVLIVAINDLHEELPLHEAILQGVAKRFRTIVLTTLTTFFGLLPMIFETSVQARFLVPMAISLGCGILFVTVIVLALVPALYMIVEDAKRLAAWVRA